MLLLMVVNMYKHVSKVVSKILQGTGSAVTQIMLGGLTIHPRVAISYSVLAGSRQKLLQK